MCDNKFDSNDDNCSTFGRAAKIDKFMRVTNPTTKFGRNSAVVSAPKDEGQVQISDREYKENSTYRTDLRLFAQTIRASVLRMATSAL